MGLEQIQVELQDCMGSDRRIAEAAWTSSYGQAKQQDKTDEEVARVVRMMAKSGHGTPFESVVMRFWIRLPIFTDRQHMTHRIATHNGLSGRYRTIPTDYYDIPDDVQDLFDKASGGDIKERWTRALGHDAKFCELDLLEMYLNSCEIAANNYRMGVNFLKEAEKDKLITNAEFKRVREVWRAQVPVGTMVERVSIFNLRSFANYMRHRLSPHAQQEIQQVARLMLQQVKDKAIAPVALEELEKQNWILEPDMPT